MVRIPYGVKGPSSSPRPVVFLQHGLVDTCETWLVGTPQQALGYIFADAGFDVWLGNIRGNPYSPPPHENWSWSWDEMAEYDLPAQVSQALNVTGESSLTYIGHSQGTMMMFAKGTETELAGLVNAFIALAPVAYLAGTTAPLLQTIAKVKSLTWIIGLLNLQEFDIETIPHLLCKYIPFVCSLTICGVAGCEGGITNDMDKQMSDYFPSTTSWQNLVHYQQAIETNEFQKFDYGPVTNLKKYGQSTPPKYSLNGWSIPSFLFWGGRDTLADPTDVKKLIPLLPRNIVNNTFLPSYGHGSFVWNEYAHQELYPTIVGIARDAANRLGKKKV